MFMSILFNNFPLVLFSNPFPDSIVIPASLCDIEIRMIDVSSWVKPRGHNPSICMAEKRLDKVTKTMIGMPSGFLEPLYLLLGLTVVEKFFSERVLSVGWVSQ